VHPHALRHTYATNANGMSVYQIQLTMDMQILEPQSVIYSFAIANC
jgi:hypothetical protein